MLAWLGLLEMLGRSWQLQSLSKVDSCTDDASLVKTSCCCVVQYVAGEGQEGNDWHKERPFFSLLNSRGIRTTRCIPYGRAQTLFHTSFQVSVTANDFLDACCKTKASSACSPFS